MSHKEKILIHHCCAPCSPALLEEFLKTHEVESLWFNPNIHPEQEQELRKSALEKYLASKNVKLHYGPMYLSELWQQTHQDSKKERCKFCYQLRLGCAAVWARKLGIGQFTTTLLSSPFQAHELVKELGHAAAKLEGVKFVYKDFREKYYEGKNKIKNEGYYVQKYCGCMPSLIEREKERRHK